ncbi:hypothetical protein [Paraburkholderia sp. SIMBA_054]|uniref:hypothetical protein n=1 Tax=Paraburkholderia sp. SIMBA_054 TaxID=3085795 RepID=UPI003979359B
MSLARDAKALIYEQLIIQGLSKAQLGRMTGLAPKEIDRILDLKHNTKIETLELVMEYLGYQLVTTVRRCIPRKLGE